MARQRGSTSIEPPNAARDVRTRPLPVPPRSPRRPGRVRPAHPILAPRREQLAQHRPVAARLVLAVAPHREVRRVRERREQVSRAAAAASAISARNFFANVAQSRGLRLLAELHRFDARREVRIPDVVPVLRREAAAGTPRGEARTVPIRKPSPATREPPRRTMRTVMTPLTRMRHQSRAARRPPHVVGSHLAS